jgi:hypothetical protein
MGGEGSEALRFEDERAPETAFWSQHVILDTDADIVVDG